MILRLPEIIQIEGGISNEKNKKVFLTVLLCVTLCFYY